MDELIDFYTQMLADLPSQFRNKEKINSLVYALSRQLNHVRGFYRQLGDLRSLKSAAGRQLEHAGNIVGLSRSQASVLADRLNSNEVMDDELYSRYLAYKIFLNTNTCTYPEIIKALKMFWDASPLYYSEDPAYPATMFFRTPTLKPEAEAYKLLQLPVPQLKAAGITLKLIATTETLMPPETMRAGGVVCGGITSTLLPAYEYAYVYGDTVRILVQSYNITETILPGI